MKSTATPKAQDKLKVREQRVSIEETLFNSELLRVHSHQAEANANISFDDCHLFFNNIFRFRFYDGPLRFI